jgi:radical SAM superfamily enzyme YgiQ (UPF0313 family)
MKKFLLVKKPYSFFPIGLAHVMTALRKSGIAYDFVDMNHDKLDWQTQLRQGAYCGVGMGGLYADFNFIADFAHTVKRLAPRTPFVLGGNMTTDIRKDILFEHIPLDFAVIGEGEHTLVELIHHFHAPVNDLNAIAGIVYRGKDGLPVSAAARNPVDLKAENLYPTWDDININYYLSLGYPGYEKFTAMPVLTGRGCTGRCTFCSPTNGRYRMRPIEQVIDELKQLSRSYQFTGFAFLNEIMYPTQKMLLEFLQAYKQSGINKPWLASLRVDIGIDLLKAMKDAGCIGANCGIESGNDRVLRQMRKNITVQQVTDFYRNCKTIGLPAQGSIMYGNETETEEELRQTVDLMIHEDIHSIGGALLIAYPGTEVYKRAVNQGRIKDEYTYLKNLDFSDSSIAGSFRNNGYLNVSAMPDDTLFQVMVRQASRHRTYNYFKYAAQDVDLKNLRGRCPTCGASITMEVDSRCMLNCVSYCTQCYSPVYFHLYELEPFKNHAAMLRQHFEQSRRIAVYGTGINACYLHLHDVFWLDHNRLIGFADELDQWKGAYFFNARVVPLKSLPDLQPDFVLIADTRSPVYARTNLANIGIREEICAPLLPPAWDAFIWELYEQNHKCA